MKLEILQQYSTIVEFLGKTLGQDYEIVLHDLDTDKPSIIAIANGHISGRAVGSPLTGSALQMLSSKTYEEKHFMCNYTEIGENGHPLRSSTMFIKDPEGKPVGLLCINFDDSRFMEIQDNLLSTIHPAVFLENNTESDTSVPPISKTLPVSAITENYPMDIPSLMQKIFDDATVSLPTSIDRLNQYERKDIIEKLNEQGLFQLKGAISFVAKKFSCSTATIYRYLSEISD